MTNSNTTQALVVFQYCKCTILVQPVLYNTIYTILDFRYCSITILVFLVLYSVTILVLRYRDVTVKIMHCYIKLYCIKLQASIFEKNYIFPWLSYWVINFQYGGNQIVDHTCCRNYCTNGLKIWYFTKCFVNGHISNNYEECRYW